MSSKQLIYKIATEPWEFEQIHALNYRTFTEEIPQHEANIQRQRIDKFHEENTYIIGLDGSRVAAMIAIRASRPFSLDQKLPNLESYLPNHQNICEIRLLAVEKAYRNSFVFYRLAETLIAYCLQQNYDIAVISGVMRQQKLYRHMGFIPFGPKLGSGEASFQPMYVSEALFKKKTRAFHRIFRAVKHSPAQAAPANFLPGPVTISPGVKRALEEHPISHRAEDFLQLIRKIQNELTGLTGARYAQVLLGSGTLGNDVVAAQLKKLSGSGLILVNGEFGSRLTEHADRMDLNYQVLETEWGKSFHYGKIQTLVETGKFSWVWMVHLETSTGVLQQLDTMKQLAAAYHFRLAVDCCSSLGNVSVDLSGVYLASSGSGKGLASFAGLSFVFHNHAAAPDQRIPKYIDLGCYAANESVPYTHSSNLLSALLTAVSEWKTDEKLIKKAANTAYLIQQCQAHQLPLLTEDAHAIVTLQLPTSLNAENVGQRLEKAGYLVSCKSSYLTERNWMQLAVMSEQSKAAIAGVTEALAEELAVKDRQFI